MRSDTHSLSASVAPFPGMDRQVGLGRALTANELLEDERRPRGWLVRRALITADIVGLCVAFALAETITGTHGGRVVGGHRELLLFTTTLPFWILVADLYGLYGRDQERADHSTTDDLTGVFHLVTIGTWLLFVVLRLTGLATPAIPKLVVFWLLAVCLVPLARTVARVACQGHPAFKQNAVIVGAGDVGQLVARKLLKHPEYGINLVGFIDSQPRTRRVDLPEETNLLGGTDRLAEIIELLHVERVVLAFSNESEHEMLALIRRIRGLNVQVDIVPRLFELMGPRVTVHMVEGLSLVGLPPVRLTFVSRALKRTIDIIGASVALLATAPLFAFIAIRIARDSPGGVFFRQTRVGMGKKEFTALKFRTMKVGTDTSVHEHYIQRTMTSSAATGANGMYKLDRSDVVTRAGRWLRKTSLDELPQLLNVLKGDMSIVGPRPCIPYEMRHFQPHHNERFLLPQGITGLWQVTARANSTFGEALDMDVAYVRGWSLALDLRLMLRTPLALLRQRGATG